MRQVRNICRIFSSCNWKEFNYNKIVRIIGGILEVDVLKQIVNLV